MSARPNRTKDKSKKLLCYCNGIPLETVQKAIDNGATTMGQIFDRTTAGCGPCGGSCQPEIRKLLEQSLKKKKESGK